MMKSKSLKPRVSITHSLTKLLKYKVCYVKFRISRRLWINIYDIEIYKSAWSLFNCTKDFCFKGVYLFVNFSCAIVTIQNISTTHVWVHDRCTGLCVLSTDILLVQCCTVHCTPETPPTHPARGRSSTVFMIAYWTNNICKILKKKNLKFVVKNRRSEFPFEI